MQIPPVDRNPIQWTNTQGANLYSTGASGPAAIRPVHAVNAVESTDQLGEGVTVTIKNPERPTDKKTGSLTGPVFLSGLGHQMADQIRRLPTSVHGDKL